MKLEDESRINYSKNLFFRIPCLVLSQALQMACPSVMRGLAEKRIYNLEILYLLLITSLVKLSEFCQDNLVLTAAKVVIINMSGCNLKVLPLGMIRTNNLYLIELRSK